MKTNQLMTINVSLSDKEKISLLVEHKTYLVKIKPLFELGNKYRINNSILKPIQTPYELIRTYKFWEELIFIHNKLIELKKIQTNPNLPPPISNKKSTNESSYDE